MYELPTATCHVNYWLMPAAIKKQTTPALVIAAGCKALNVTEDEMFSKSRKRSIVRARYICMMIIKRKIKISLKEIGNLFGLDHTTVMHGISQIEDDLTVMAYRAETNQLISSVIELL